MVRAICLAFQVDMRERRSLGRIKPLEAVAHQLQVSFLANKIKPGLQAEEFLNNAHRDPIEVFQGLIFLGQVEEGLERVVFQGAKVILPERLAFFLNPGHDLDKIRRQGHGDFLESINCEVCFII
jgi:hypothetical protein